MDGQQGRNHPEEDGRADARDRRDVELAHHELLLAVLHAEHVHLVDADAEPVVELARPAEEAEVHVALGLVVRGPHRVRGHPVLRAEARPEEGEGQAANEEGEEDEEAFPGLHPVSHLGVTGSLRSLLWRGEVSQNLLVPFLSTCFQSFLLPWPSCLFVEVVEFARLKIAKLAPSRAVNADPCVVYTLVSPANNVFFCIPRRLAWLNHSAVWFSVHTSAKSKRTSSFQTPTFPPSLVATDDAADEFWKILRAALRSIAGKMWEKRRDCIFLMLPKTT